MAHHIYMYSVSTISNKLIVTAIYYRSVPSADGAKQLVDKLNKQQIYDRFHYSTTVLTDEELINKFPNATLNNQIVIPRRLLFDYSHY